MVRWLAVFGTVWLLGGCSGGDDAPDAGTGADAGTVADAGSPPDDAGDLADAGDGDAGDADAGAGDAGDDVDAGDVDAGDVDAGPVTVLELFEGPALTAPDEVLDGRHGLSKDVHDASHDAAGNLWAADFSSVYVRRAGLGAFEQFSSGFKATDLRAISGGLGGVAWVGYQGEGDDTGREPIEWRETGGVAKVELDGADVRVTDHLLIAPPGKYAQYPDGRYKLRTCFRAFGVKSGPFAGEAWFGCNHGVGMVSADYGVIEHHHPIKCLWDPVDQRCTEKSGSVGAVAFLPDGDVWMGGTYGVMLLDYAAGARPGNFWGPEPVRNEPLFPNPIAPNQWGSTDVKGLAVAADGSLWAASEHSGLIHRLPDGRIVEYREADGLPSNRFADIALDSQGGLWLGTLDGGVARLDTATGEWRRVPGLPSSLVNPVVVEQVATGEKITIVVRGAVAVYDGPPQD